MSENLTKDSLQKSIKIVGELYPVLENQNGKILDGSHRIESNPKHHRKTIQTKNRTEEILIRLHAHHRRQIPQEETKAMLLELATELEASRIECRTISAEIAKLTPYSDRYIQMLLPEKYKQPEKAEAGKAGAVISQQKSVSAELTPQTVKSKVPCPKCPKVFDSELECRIHWSHNHPGAAPASLAKASDTTSTPTSTPSTPSTPHIEPAPELPQLEPEEPLPPDTPICPICEATMDITEYQEIKQRIAKKYGLQIQTLLFPTTQNKTKKA